MEEKEDEMEVVSYICNSFFKMGFDLSFDKQLPWDTIEKLMVETLEGNDPGPILVEFGYMLCKLGYKTGSEIRSRLETSYASRN